MAYIELFRQLHPFTGYPVSNALMTQCIRVLNSKREWSINPDNIGALKLARFIDHAQKCQLLANWRDHVHTLEPMLPMEARKVMDKYGVLSEDTPDLLLGTRCVADSATYTDGGGHWRFLKVEVAVTYGSVASKYYEKDAKDNDVIIIFGKDTPLDELPDGLGKIFIRNGWAIYAEEGFQLLKLNREEMKLLLDQVATLNGLLLQVWGNNKAINDAMQTDYDDTIIDPLGVLDMAVNTQWDNRELTRWRRHLISCFPKVEEVELLPVNPGVPLPMESKAEEEEIEIKWNINKNEENWLHTPVNPTFPIHETTRQSIWESLPDWLPIRIMSCGRHFAVDRRDDTDVMVNPTILAMNLTREVVKLMRAAKKTTTPYMMWSNVLTTEGKYLGGIGFKPGKYKGITTFGVDKPASATRLRYEKFKLTEYKKTSYGDSGLVEEMIESHLSEEPDDDYGPMEWAETPDKHLWDRTGKAAAECTKHLCDKLSNTYFGHFLRAAGSAMERVVQNKNLRTYKPKPTRLQCYVMPMWSGKKGADDKCLLFGTLIVARVSGGNQYITSVYWYPYQKDVNGKTLFEAPMPFAAQNYTVVHCAQGVLYWATMPIQNPRLTYWVVLETCQYLTCAAVDTEIYLMCKQDNIDFRLAYQILVESHWKAIIQMFMTTFLYRVAPTNESQEMCSIATLFMSAHMMRKEHTTPLCFDNAALNKKFYGTHGRTAEFMFRIILDLWELTLPDTYVKDKSYINTFWLDNCRFYRDGIDSDKWVLDPHHTGPNGEECVTPPADSGWNAKGNRHRLNNMMFDVEIGKQEF